MEAFAILFLIGMASAVPMASPGVVKYNPKVLANRARFEAAAKAEFQAVFAAAVSLNKDTAFPKETYPLYTPDVATARDEFMAVYNRAYLAALEAKAAAEAAAAAKAEAEAKAKAEAELRAAEEAALEDATEAAPEEEAIVEPEALA
ncbi:uncharacterized protein LOC143034338 [Oratosquilla oratoria]|uniref:uncharacterized protein LOC143034338 n=1 Tax=Oratosquilla oratoria TaxID=337810 RepID=UPI003F77652D